MSGESNNTLKKRRASSDDGDCLVCQETEEGSTGIVQHPPPATSLFKRTCRSSETDNHHHVNETDSNLVPQEHSPVAPAGCDSCVGESLVLTSAEADAPQTAQRQDRPLEPLIVIPWHHALFGVHDLIDWDKCPNFYIAGGRVLNAIVGDTLAMRSSDVDVWVVGSDRPSQTGDKNHQPSLEPVPLSLASLSEQATAMMSHLQHKHGLRHAFKESKQTAQGYVDFLLASDNCRERCCLGPRCDHCYQAFPSRSSVESQLKCRVDDTAAINLQLIFSRCYRDVFHLLRTFDLPNVQFAYHGGYLFATQAAMQYLDTLHIDAYWDPLLDSPDLRNTGVLRKKQCRLQKYKNRTYHTFTVTKTDPPPFWSGDGSRFYFESGRDIPEQERVELTVQVVRCNPPLPGFPNDGQRCNTVCTFAKGNDQSPQVLTWFRHDNNPPTQTHSTVGEEHRQTVLAADPAIAWRSVALDKLSVVLADKLRNWKTQLTETTQLPDTKPRLELHNVWPQRFNRPWKIDFSAVCRKYPADLLPAVSCRTVPAGCYVCPVLTNTDSFLRAAVQLEEASRSPLGESRISQLPWHLVVYILLLSYML